MPDYEYRCSSCGATFIQHESLDEHARSKQKPRCARCGSGRVEQTLGAVYVRTSKKS